MAYKFKCRWNLSLLFAATVREDIYKKPATSDPLTTLKTKLLVEQNYNTSDKISNTRTIICHLLYLLIFFILQPTVIIIILQPTHIDNSYIITNTMYFNLHHVYCKCWHVLLIRCFVKNIVSCFLFCCLNPYFIQVRGSLNKFPEFFSYGHFYW